MVSNVKYYRILIKPGWHALRGFSSYVPYQGTEPPAPPQWRFRPASRTSLWVGDRTRRHGNNTRRRHKSCPVTMGEDTDRARLFGDYFVHHSVIASRWRHTALNGRILRARRFRQRRGTPWRRNRGKAGRDGGDPPTKIFSGQPGQCDRCSPYT